MDPLEHLSVGAWVAVAGYAVAAPLAWRRRGDASPRGRLLWSLLALLFIGLALVRVFDLTASLTAVGRGLARDEHWYNMRRPIQFAWVVVMCVALFYAVAQVSKLRSQDPPALGRVILGALFLLALYAVRTISFHGTDQLLKLGVPGIHLNGLLEAGGLAWIIVSILRPSAVSASPAPPPLPPTPAAPPSRIAGRPHRPGTGGERPVAREWSSHPDHPSNSRPGSPPE